MVLLADGAIPIPGYRLLRRLGGGGYGEVWAAEAPGGFPVALKFLRPERGKCDDELRILQALKDVKHPRLLDIQFARRIDDTVVIGMPLCEQSLADRLNQCRQEGSRGIPPAELLRYLRECAEGIDFLNQEHALPDGQRVRIQHRDIKPQNLFLVGGSVRIADFGLAKLCAHTLTSAPVTMSLPYAAPESFNGQAAPTTDQYSLAVTYCQLRAGFLPFTGTPAELLKAHVMGEPNLAGLPGPERAIVRQALSKDPAVRWPTCREFVERLAAVFGTPATMLEHPAAGTGSGSAASDWLLPSEYFRDTVAPASASAPLVLPPSAVTATGAAPTRPRSRLAFVVLLLVGLAAAVAGTGWYIARVELAELRSRLEAVEGAPGKGGQTNGSSKPLANTPTALPDEVVSAGIKFRRVPKGKSWMSEGGKHAQKQVTIAEDFYLGVYEVTQGQWQAVMGDNPSWFCRTGKGADDVKEVSDEELKQFPVEMVSWDDVQEFITKINKIDSDGGWVYRLPTEAEWEYACHGGATSLEECFYDFYFLKPTNALSSFQANFQGKNPAGGAGEGPYLGRTTKVGSYPEPNKLGLYDMHGNVWEWCQDLYSEGGSTRVFRGGGWGNYGMGCRAAIRDSNTPSGRGNGLGFRLARVPSGK